MTRLAEAAELILIVFIFFCLIVSAVQDIRKDWREARQLEDDAYYRQFRRLP